MSVRFLLPHDSAAISGGNLYNAGLLEALERRSAGQRGSILELPALLHAETPGDYLLDTLDLARAEVLARRAPGQRFGLVVHQLPSLEPELDPQSEAVLLEGRVLPLFDFWIATSDYTRGLLLGRGFPAERVLTLLPGLSPAPRSARDLPFPPSVAVVGNLIPRKGVLPLLSGLATRVEPRDQFELSLVGRTEQEPDYAQACRDAAESSPFLRKLVRFRGALAPSEMPALYRATSLLVSASAMETFGMALQEARAHGVPILALDRGNAREHVTPEVNGWLVDSLDGVCDTLLGLVREPSRLRRMFERAAHAPIATKSWDELAVELLEFIAGVDRRSSLS